MGVVYLVRTSRHAFLEARHARVPEAPPSARGAGDLGPAKAESSVRWRARRSGITGEGDLALGPQSPREYAEHSTAWQQITKSVCTRHEAMENSLAVEGGSDENSHAPD